MKIRTHLWPVVAVFFTVALLTSGLLGALQPMTGIPTVVIQLTQLGPLLGVVVVALCWPVRTREALAGAVGGRGGTWAPLLLLSVTAVLVIGAAAAGYGLLTGDVRATAPADLGNPFVLIVVAQFAGACAEEIGWRCLLQPLLRTRLGVVAASVVVGVLWGVWHLPVFAHDAAYVVGFLLAAVSMSVALGVALDGVRAQRLVLAGAFHTLTNLGMLLFMDEESGVALPMILFGCACLVAAVAWLGRRTSIAAVRENVRSRLG
ncbi:abortive phage infection protein [Actinosynnema sp. ALI-1.44]|uniref:CPBP family glutamic-type intramembrane protease n=1 Tax=Actinosynnema sp. ALI-1.44 TaxID=1933779 RepID=UPI00097BDCA5|nr:CPBP family glutamic-type intramembrane protease [Actinosynnema sp. ALI-1.44]ONI79510.1 abortive phage infection protein [Actinosynnema sp. ALI-1.44]